MTWPEILSVIATMGAAGSLWVAYMAYRITALQALPHPDIGWTRGSSGHRNLDFKISRGSGNADWAVATASIRGNWRRRRHIAFGQLVHEEEFDDGTLRIYEASGPWEHQLVFNPPRTGGAIVLHPDAPDCEVKLKITLRTLPSPTVTRRIKLDRLNIKH